MSRYDNHKDMCVDLKLDNDELREKLAKTNESLGEALRENRKLFAKNLYLENSFRLSRVHTNPLIDKYDEDGIIESHCDECEYDLEREWTFCPCCGNWLDWDFARVPEPNWDMMRDAMLDR